MLLAFITATVYGQGPSIESITFIHNPPEGQGERQKFVIRADDSNDFSSRKISLDRANAHIENHLKYEGYPKHNPNSLGVMEYDPRGIVTVFITLTRDDSTYYLLSDMYSEGEAVEIPCLRLLSESDQKLICKNLGTDCEAGELLDQNMSAIGTKVYLINSDYKKGLVDADNHIVLPVEYDYFDYVDFGAIESSVKK